MKSGINKQELQVLLEYDHISVAHGTSTFTYMSQKSQLTFAHLSNPWAYPQQQSNSKGKRYFYIFELVNKKQRSIQMNMCIQTSRFPGAVESRGRLTLWSKKISNRLKVVFNHISQVKNCFFLFSTLEKQQQVTSWCRFSIWWSDTDQDFDFLLGLLRPSPFSPVESNMICKEL